MTNVRLMVALTLSCLLPPVHALTLKVCAEADDFPPFDYRTESRQQAIIGDSTGSSIEMLHALSKSLKFSVSLHRLPWSRCMQAVESGAMDMALDAYFDNNRAKRFDYSGAYYFLTPQLFYLRSRFPDGPPSQTIANLKGLRGCGIHGYSYAHYGLQASDLDNKAKTHEQLVAKLKAGHCDYFLEELEILQGFALTGQNYLADQQIRSAQLADAKHPKLHLLLSRNSRVVQTLKPALNQAIEKYVRDGEMIRSVTRQLRR